MSIFQTLVSGSRCGKIGGKASGLRSLQAAGLRVPDCRVITAGTAGKIFKRAGDRFYLVPEYAKKFRKEAGRLWPRGRLIARSSAVCEDLPGASAAGVYASRTAAGFASLPGAVASCLSSVFGRRAKSYKKARGIKSGGRGEMAVIIHPFLTAGFGGVCLLYHKKRAIIELSSSGPASVTSGRGAGLKAVFDFRGRRWTGLPGGGTAKRAVLAALEAALRVQKTVMQNMDIGMEFLFGGGKLTVLQARAVPGPACGAASQLDMELIYARIYRIMRAIGFARGDWSLLESSDLLAFNYLGVRRLSNETLEHFRVLLLPRGRRKAEKWGWFPVRCGDGGSTLFPAANDFRRQRLLSAAAGEGLLFIFLAGPGAAVKRIGFVSGAFRFRMPFSHLPAKFTGHERKFMRSRLDPDSAAAFLERLELEKYNLSRVRSVLGWSAYELKLAARLKGRLRQIAAARRIAAAFLREKNAGRSVIGVPFRPEKRIIRGKVVFGRDIAWSRERRFIYAAHDLEPSFLSRISRISAAVVSRGAMCSHAAALCDEFRIPLIVETRNIRLLATGKTASVDMSSGKVTLGRRRPALRAGHLMGRPGSGCSPVYAGNPLQRKKKGEGRAFLQL